MKAGYHIINRLELFLSAIVPSFEISLENPLTIKDYRQENVADIASSINRVADNLKQECFKLTELARKGEKETDWRGFVKEPSQNLEFQIKQLIELKESIDLIWRTYI